MQYLEFYVGKQKYGIEVENIIQVLENINITSSPDAEDFVMGITTVREKIVPVIDLSKKLQTKSLKKNYKNNQFIVAEYKGYAMAFAITEALNIVEVSEEQVKDIPRAFLPDEPLVKYLIKNETGLTSILNIKKFFYDELETGIEVGA